MTITSSVTTFITLNTQDRQGTDSTARHDTASASNARQQRQGYSRVAELVKIVNSNADAGNRTLAESIRELEEHDRQAEHSLQWLGSSEKNIFRANEQLSVC